VPPSSDEPGGPVDVIVVILNYRTPELTLEALRAALPEVDSVRGDEARRGLPAAERSRIALVDNASGDGSVPAFRRAIAEARLGDRVDLLVSPENGGYAAGNNLAFRWYLGRGMRPRFFHVLNSDAFLTPGALPALLGVARARGRVAACASRLDEPRAPDGGRAGDGSGEAAHAFPSLVGEALGPGRLRRCPGHLSRWSAPATLGETAGPVDWVLGASLLLRTTALEEVGFFDEGFFLYFEDIDLCRRLRDARWDVWTVPESRAVHLGSASTGLGAPGARIPPYWFASRARYYRKHHGPGYLAAADALALAGGALDRIARGRRGPSAPAGFVLDLLADVSLRALGMGPGQRDGTALARRRSRPAGRLPADRPARPAI